MSDLEIALSGFVILLLIVLALDFAGAWRDR